ncbi:branched-chain amino acid transporter permease [Anaerofustis stercorihominis]|uniref:Branched-chain amino acid transporter AzlD n=1 Tax=Anaerofustis stercorihominis TaxID=214853 RepID=A0A3E3DYR3_9FIRM|nr:AzlD domain-containing protein [Anaerofustis stercorihominis]RGD74373.1 branched-chain amino acid transporter AzlD [Anaerofustis stercorihominis]
MNKYTLIQGLLAIGIMCIITFITRSVPFVLFSGKGKKPSDTILYLGKVLPPAMMIMLLVYCLKDMSLIAYPYGIPEIIGVLLAVGLHIWKRNNFISIFGSTIVYMILVQAVFV